MKRGYRLVVRSAPGKLRFRMPPGTTPFPYLAPMIATSVSTELLRDALGVFVAKTRANLADMPARPTTWSFAMDGDYTKWPEGFFEIGNWTNGFFTGMGVLALKSTSDNGFLDLLDGLKPLFGAKVEGEHARNTMHDLGFLYSPYAVAIYQHTGGATYRDLALKAARTLAGRYISNGGYFRAWGRMDEVGTEYEGLAIIDCLMNMPLLHWASRETGDPSFREMALRHTNNTLRRFVRPDDSVYHSFRFDRDTGAAVGPDNYCGHAVESHWARGNSWAMYGFALAYKHGGNEAHLDASLRVSKKFVSCLDDGGVPLWDFRLTPGCPPLRDSSAAAVAVCAIQELESLGVSDNFLSDAKQAMLTTLLSRDYFDSDPAVRGVLRKGEVGDGADPERRFYRAKYAYTSWGDYFLMEAISRELGQQITWW